MVKRWYTEIRCERTCTTDTERSGYPFQAATHEIFEKIHDMVTKRCHFEVIYKQKVSELNENS